MVVLSVQNKMYPEVTELCYITDPTIHCSTSAIVSAESARAVTRGVSIVIMDLLLISPNTFSKVDFFHIRELKIT